MSNRTTVFISLVALFVITSLVACGPKKATISATMTDYKYTPNTWEVPAGGQITLNLKNEGTLEHEFVIMALGTEATMPFDDNDEGNVFWEHELESGESASVEFTAPAEPGVYQVVCGTAGHLEQGMQGTLTVK